MNTIEQRMKDILTDQAIGDRVPDYENVYSFAPAHFALRNAILALAHEVSRLEALRRECGEGEAVGPALAFTGDGRIVMGDMVPKATLDAVEKRAKMFEAQASFFKSLADKRDIIIRAQERRIAELKDRLAERDADAEVGKAIRELRPRKGEHSVHLYVLVNNADRNPDVFWADPSEGERRATRGWWRLNTEDVQRCNRRRED